MLPARDDGWRYKRRGMQSSVRVSSSAGNLWLLSWPCGSSIGNSDQPSWLAWRSCCSSSQVNAYRTVFPVTANYMTKHHECLRSCSFVSHASFRIVRAALALLSRECCGLAEATKLFGFLYCCAVNKWLATQITTARERMLTHKDERYLLCTVHDMPIATCLCYGCTVMLDV